MKNLSILLFATLYILNSQITNAQKGWNKTTKDSKLVYTPTTLKQGKSFQYILSKPINLNGQSEKDWLLKNAKKAQNVLGKPIDPWKVKQEKTGGWSVSNTYFNQNGKKMSVGYASKPTKNKVYLLQMISSYDVGILLKYGMQINRVTNNAESTFANNGNYNNIPTVTKNKRITNSTSRTTNRTSIKKKSKLTGRQKRELIERSIRTTAGKGVKPSQIQALWVDSGIDVLRGGIKVNTYLLLKDGSVYMDCEIPPNELLIHKSKELQSKKWTTWRLSGNSYQIKHKKSNSWKTLKGRKTIKSIANQKLATKFITTGGSQIRGSWKNSITFKANGRFEMSRFSMKDNSGLGGGVTAPSVNTVRTSDKKGTRGTTTVSGNGIGGGTTTQKNNGAANTGTYYLKGNTITLKHDNGYVHTELFVFDKADKKSFIYKDDRYWIPKK